MDLFVLLSQWIPRLKNAFLYIYSLDKKKYNGLMELKEEFHDRAETIEVMLGDCNENIGEVLDQIPRHAPCFAFLDPEGTELSWETIEKLSTHKKGYKYKIELFVLFPYDMGLVRLLNHDVKEFWQTNYPLLLNKIYGNSKWVEIYEKRATGLLSADDARDKFLRLYMSQIDQLGYAHVIEKLIERDDGHPLYFMIFATDIEVGDRVMRHIFGRDRDTQMSFGFPYASRRNHVED
ncbi:MAG: three-Cys-motif partner protein TcmP [Actinobacteria bacterium]|nr:three-Cys-motif partner protein TcmP [Actinomycetota bacterium]